MTATGATKSSYFKNIWDSLWSNVMGLAVTGKYLWKEKPITVQYPDERLPIPDRYRGIHYLEQEKCIYCFQCARACPVDCIEMEAVRKGKELEWVKFTIDYNKCIFCELCVYPCPKDCIHMGKEFALVSYDRKEFNLDLLSYKGMSPDAKVRFEQAEKEKAAKAAAAAAAKAAAPAAPAAGAATATATPPAAAAPKPAAPQKPPEPPTS